MNRNQKLLAKHMRKKRSSPEPSPSGWSEPFKGDKTLRVCAGCNKTVTLAQDSPLWFSNMPEPTVRHFRCVPA